MSRSLGRKVLAKAGNLNYEDKGREMFARGEPCPRKPASHGKEHSLWRGWQRAATEARNKKGLK
jgi:hypothetical protein